MANEPATAAQTTDPNSPYEMTVDLSVLEALGINLYSNAAAVLTEMVANAYDADATRVTIDWKQDEERIIVTDTGIASGPLLKLDLVLAECFMCGEEALSVPDDQHPMCEGCLSRCYYCGRDCEGNPCEDARQAAVDRADLERRRALEPPTRCFGPRHWRRWRLTGWVFSRLYVLGITAWGGSSSNKCTRPTSLRDDCPGHSGWVRRGPGWRALDPRRKRFYVLGMRTEWLALLPTCLRAGHWPLWLEGMGCGKCAPWPCCGATGYDHAEGCTEA